MNIAFDATALLADMSRNRGIGSYTASQFRTMIRESSEDMFYCLNLYNEQLPYDWEERFDNFKEISFFSGKSIELIRMEQYEELVGRIICEFNEKYDIDVFYLTSPFNMVTYPYKKEWFSNTCVVATIYDAIPYLFPDKYFTNRNVQLKYERCVEQLRWADALLSISKSAKDDFVKHLGIDDEKITIIDGAPNRDIYRVVNIGDEEKNALLSQYEIDADFMICVGGEDSRKNLDGLIRAFASSKASTIYKLVIVCKLSVAYREMLYGICDECGLSGKVILTGFVSDDELVQLMNLSKAMLFPSKYEGFGLPIVEAWCCNLPVMTSNTSSLREIAKEAAIMTNPYSIEDMARGIDILIDDNERENWIKKGIEKANKYTWELTAHKTLEILHSLNLKKKKEKICVKRIAMFAPLPPMESGISDYSYDIIESLSKYYDVDVYIDNNYTPNCILPENVNYYPHYKYVENMLTYDETIYQMGCSSFHQYMFDYVREFPGIVVLHDLNMHPVLEFVYGIKPGYKYITYKKYLCEDMSESEALRFIDKRLSNLDSSSLDVNVVNGFITNYAKSIIVHSMYSKRWLNDKNILRNVYHIPLYAKLYKESSHVPNKIFTFSVNGIITDRKRPVQIIKAFRKLIESGVDAQLVFVGKYCDENIKCRIENMLSDSILKNRVRITGFVEMDEFISEIESADAHINLRFPYYGENSAVLSRVLGMGRCVIVNAIGSFDEVPDAACIKIPAPNELPGTEEIEMIYEAMMKAMNTGIRTEIEKNAYEYAKKTLSLEAITEKYRRVIENTDIRYLTSSDIRKYLKQTEKVISYNEL